MFVKICGITREEDALLAVAMGADAVGFTFAPSKRQVAAGIARDIARRLPPEILTVGVFRDEAPARVIDIVHSAGLKGAQLHGHESAEDTRFIRSRVGFVIKAFSAGSPELANAAAYGADAILVDGATPGSGQVFDWSLVDRVPVGLQVVLAGGLHPDNVTEAIERVGPWGVDVASGVEADRGDPGQKDAVKVKRFVERAKAAEPAPHAPVADGPFDWMEDDLR